MTETMPEALASAACLFQLARSASYLVLAAGDVRLASFRFVFSISSIKRGSFSSTSRRTQASAALPPQASSALCLLPGSRPHEIEANLPLMLQAAELIAVEVATRFDRSGSSAAPCRAV